MADGCLLLVDSSEGVMPQTRFVLRKAFACGLRPIIGLVVEVDQPDAHQRRTQQHFRLFVELDAGTPRSTACHLPRAGQAVATSAMNVPAGTIKPLYDAILHHVPPPGRSAAPRSRCW